jgi:hypothetical protein
MKQLTKEQEEIFSTVYIPKWMEIGLRTDPCQFEKSKEFAIKAYKKLGLKVPKVFFLTDCPISCGQLSVRLYYERDQMRKNGLLSKDSDLKAIKKVEREIKKGIPFDTSKVENYEQKVRNAINDQCFGNMEAGWLSFYEFFNKECQVDITKVESLLELANYCGWWAPYSECVIFQHRPTAIHIEDFTNAANGQTQKRLHNANGPAVEYRGGLSNVYAVHGVRVPKKVVERTFTAQDIDNEDNAEVRRVMVDFYGADRYLLETKAEIINSDDFGTLYRKPQRDDEDIWMVKVVNSTIEKDGTFKEYMIPVDPNILNNVYKQLTGRAAVASTWRNEDGSLVFAKPEDYDPQIES